MSYKVVETVERGKKVLSIVPQQWEQNGILKWPRKNYEKLKLDPDSKPEKSWLPMQCKVKRNNLQSYDAAAIEINIMSDNTDTEMEEEEFCGVPSVTEKNFDFNDLVRSTIKDQGRCVQDVATDNKVSIAPTQNPPALSAQELFSPTYFLQETPAAIDVEQTPSTLTVQENPAEGVNLQSVYFVTDTTTTDFSRGSHTHNEILSQKIDNLTKIAYELQNNQQNIMLKLASVTTLVEEYMKKITYKEINNATSTNFKAISDVKMLQDFESSLENPDLKQELMKKLSIVCSKGKGKGINNAYILVDVMFTRKLMTECSWAGGTRKDNPKSCFKSYIHTINLFFDIIYNTDKDFTKTDCEIFFKNVLRHAVSRNSSKQLRCSAAKKRPRKNDSDNDAKKNCQRNDGTSNLTAEPIDKENVDPVARNPEPSSSQSADEVDK